MELTNYPQLGEKVYREVLSNGLTVAVVPRPGFTKKLCYFVTDFGAIHTDFTLDGKHWSVPAGIAHYLEHKMFDLPGRDVSAEFASLGAIPNAFTGYDVTAYYFSCTENFRECLDLLLEFVSTPYFTQETVQKEQGIIGQEIDMNRDNPDTQIFEMLMENMYDRHPIRIPILGRRETIAKITPENLTACHNAFYRPDNMLLCVVGDVDPEEVKAIAEKRLGNGDYPPVERVRRWEEALTCATAYEEKTMDVAMPMFHLGFKCESWEPGEEATRRELTAELAAEALFGESSPLYQQLYEAGLIDTSFGGGFETIDGMALFTASGDSNDPKAVTEAILARADQIVREGLDEADFLRMKRSALGRRIRSLDSFDATCYRICAYHFSGFDYFRFPAVYRDIQAADVCSFLKKSITRDNMSLAVILPKEEEVK
jgi:predicted Zn-dependent peptidase